MAYAIHDYGIQSHSNKRLKLGSEFKVRATTTKTGRRDNDGTSDSDVDDLLAMNSDRGLDSTTVKLLLDA